MEQEKTIEEVLNMLEMQEEILQFTHFTNGDAWELGSMMVAEAKLRGLSLAMSIRMNNGFIVFQYGGNGTNLHDEQWMRRKYNTVKEMEISSLHLFTRLKAKEQTMEDIFLDEREYACCGGGFPIHIEEGGVIGAITVTGLNHVADHDFIIRCLSKYLHTDGVPRIKKM